MSEQNHNLHTDNEYYQSAPSPEVSSQVTSFIPHLQLRSNPFEQLKSSFFNEMLDEKNAHGETSSKIEQWFSERSLEELKALEAQAEQHFHYQGITFNVYGDDEGAERAIPFDLIPRIIEKTMGENFSRVHSAC